MKKPGSLFLTFLHASLRNPKFWYQWYSTVGLQTNLVKKNVETDKVSTITDFEQEHLEESFTGLKQWNICYAHIQWRRKFAKINSMELSQWKMEYEWLNNIAYCFGNAHKRGEKIAVYCNGLQPSILTIVISFRKGQLSYEFNFKFLVQFAREEGDDIRERDISLCSQRGLLTTPQSRKTTWARCSVS